MSSKPKVAVDVDLAAGRVRRAPGLLGDMGNEPPLPELSHPGTALQQGTNPAKIRAGPMTF